MKVRIIQLLLQSLMMCCIISNAQTVVKVKKAGTLEQIAKERQLDTCGYLAIVGKLNSADIRVLRRLGGYVENGKKGGNLYALDLRRAKFMTDKDPFMVLDATKEKLAGVVHPAYVHLHPGYELLHSESKVIPKAEPGFSLTLRHKLPEGKNILRYKPIYYLSHIDNTPLGVDAPAMTQYDFNYHKPVLHIDSESQFTTVEGISDSLWKSLCKKGLDKFSGHRIEKRADGYYLLVMNKKGQFSPVTFYKCSSLQVVALPKDIKFGPDIYDENNSILYFIGKDLFLWNRDEIAPNIKAKLHRQMELWDFIYFSEDE